MKTMNDFRLGYELAKRVNSGVYADDEGYDREAYEADDPDHRRDLWVTGETILSGNGASRLSKEEKYYDPTRYRGAEVPFDEYKGKPSFVLIHNGKITKQNLSPEDDAEVDKALAELGI